MPYEAAVAAMEARVAAIRAGSARELVWLLEHPPLYTAGTSARSADLVEPGLFPVHRSGRGGQYTYHGPGQRIGYVMLDLKPRGGDIRLYVRMLEEWLIRALARLGVLPVVSFLTPALDRCACATTLRRSASASSLSVSSNSIGARRWRMCHSK